LQRKGNASHQEEEVTQRGSPNQFCSDEPGGETARVNEERGQPAKKCAESVGGGRMGSLPEITPCLAEDRRSFFFFLTKMEEKERPTLKKRGGTDTKRVVGL